MANGRRKRIVLSIEKKLEILDRLSKGESQAFLSFEYGIGKSTVADLKENPYLCGKYEFTLHIHKKHKIMQTAEDDKLDEALYQWFIQKRSQNMTVSGPVLCEKAVQ